MEHETFRILLALLCVGLVFALPYDPSRSSHHISHSAPTQNDTNKIQACGSKLSAAIALVCKGYYNTFDWALPSKEHFISKREAKTMLRRKRRGIIDECCRKACTHHELMSYCGRI